MGSEESEERQPTSGQVRAFHDTGVPSRLVGHIAEECDSDIRKVTFLSMRIQHWSPLGEGNSPARRSPYSAGSDSPSA